MVYSQQTWADAPATSSPLSSARLNHMEAGIAAAIDGIFHSTDYGYISWNYDFVRAGNAGTAMTAGLVYAQLLPIREAATITNVHNYVGVAGSGLTSGQCFAGLLDSTGALLSATADQSTPWASAGVKTMALSAAQSVAAGFYYVAFFGNGTTMPKMRADSSQNSSLGAIGPFASTPRSVLDSTHTGRTTTFPNPITKTADVSAYWVGVS